MKMNEIKYFNEYWKPYVEAFNTPVDINWTIDTVNKLYGEFHINKDRYEIICDKWQDNIWTYKFNHIENGIKTSDLINKDLNKYKTLSTVRDGMKSLLDKKEPNGLIITILDESRGREYVWDRFSKEISKEHDFEYQKMEILGVKVLMLWRNISFDKMNQAFSEISRNFI